MAVAVEPHDLPASGLRRTLSASPGSIRRSIVPSTSIAGVPLPACSSRQIGSSAAVTIGRLMPASGASGATTTASSAGETTGPPAEYA